MEQRISQLEQQIQQLQEVVELMRSSATYPYDMEQAIIDRVNPVAFTPSTKTAASETQAVDEGGSGTYNVAKPMDGFEQRVVDGVTRYFPYYL